MYRLLSATAEPSFWEAFDSVNAHTYKNLGITADRGVITLRGIILGLCVGLILAAVFTLFSKRRPGSLVRRIIEKQALSTESAQTLAELGFEKNVTLRHNLRGGVLSKFVRCVERDEYHARYEAAKEALGPDSQPEPLPPFVIDWDKHHFYIPDEKKYAAEVRYEGKGSGIPSFVLTVVVAVVIAVLGCIFLPDLLQVLDNAVGALNSNSNIA